MIVTELAPLLPARRLSIVLLDFTRCALTEILLPRSMRSGTCSIGVLLLPVVVSDAMDCDGIRPIVASKTTVDCIVRFYEMRSDGNSFATIDEIWHL
jgi:hypothetical protein